MQTCLQNAPHVLKQDREKVGPHGSPVLLKACGGHLWERCGPSP